MSKLVTCSYCGCNTFTRFGEHTEILHIEKQNDGKLKCNTITYEFTPPEKDTTVICEECGKLFSFEEGKDDDHS